MIVFDMRRDTDVVVLNDSSASIERERPDQRLDDWLQVALEDSFPCSDPISSMRTD